MLVDREVAVGELVDELELEQPAVSKHLKVLRTVDLVRCRTEGRRRLYRLNGPALEPVQHWLERYTAAVNEHYDRLDDYLATLQRTRPPTSTRSISGPQRPNDTNPTKKRDQTMTTRHGSAIVTLPSDREILITRTFEAPAALVWDAITQPRHLLRWWGPDYCPLVACDVDFRVGGDWRYLCRDMDGNELGWHGTYRDIDHGQRIVTTEVFEGFPEAEAVNTMTLTEHDGVTTLRTTVLHATKEYRDGHVASGMEGGMQLTFDRLDDLLDASGSRLRNGSAGSPVGSPTVRTRCRRGRGRTRRRATDGPPVTSSTIWSPGCPASSSRPASRSHPARPWTSIRPVRG